MLLVGVLVSGAAVVAQKWEQIAVLQADASRDETAIWVDNGDGFVLDGVIMIERRDGKLKDTYEVLHVYKKTVILKQPLRHDFPEGSRIYQ